MRPKSGSNRGNAALAVAAVIACGCESVDGGAVEVSWRLRPASSALEDKFVDCDSQKDGTNPVTAIRLDWVVEQQSDAEEWPCNDSHGVTGFVLPPGSALFLVTPICTFGPANPNSFIAPAVEQRSVIVGNTVNLGAIEVVVQVSDCRVQPCICQ
jgi:hypothetical protein